MGIVAMSLGWLRPPGETIEYVSAMVSNNSLRDEENPRPYGSLGGRGLHKRDFLPPCNGRATLRQFLLNGIRIVQAGGYRMKTSDCDS
jgi:hypothetical protein